MSMASIMADRLHMTMFTAMRLAGTDDEGNFRCLVCLALVPADRIRNPDYEGEYHRIAMAPVVHGYECLSCGMGDPPPVGDE